MIIGSKKEIPESYEHGYLYDPMVNAQPQIRSMTARQWRRAAPHIAGVSELGVRFSERWDASRLTPYIQKRFALEAACLAAAEEDHEFRYDDVWAKLFAAAPKGHRYCLDAGAAAMVATYYRKWATFSFEEMAIDRRRRTSNEAPALLAAEAAFIWASKGRAVSDAPAQAAAVLVEQGLWPSDGPLPWWASPRERTDGDWLIGALARLRKALERSLALLEQAEAFERKWREKLSSGLRDDAGALRVLTMAAGCPALTQGDVVDALGLSKKAAQKAILTLEEAGTIIEITGRNDWRVWLANDPILSPPLDRPGFDFAPSTRSNPFVSKSKRLRVAKLDAVDTDRIDAELREAMDEADDATRRLRETEAKMRA